MFKELKRRLLTMNILFIVFLLLIGFAGTYLATTSSINHDIKIELKKVTSFRPERIGTEEEKKGPKPFPDKEIPERTIAFSLSINELKEITNIFSFFNGEESFYEDALNKIDLRAGVEDKITLDDAHWAYKVVPDKEGYKVFFIDITPKIEILNLMIIAFVIVSITMILLIIVVSNYLTNQSIKPIKEAFKKQNQFISDASHELKTPLAVIQSNVDVLMQKEHSIESTKWLTYIQTEVKRMTQLTNNLLYMSQMEHSESVHTSVNISNLCEHLLLGLDAVAYEKKIFLKYEIDESIEIKGNKEQLTQLLMILLDNALKFSHSNAEVLLTLGEHHGQIEISITNTGTEIPSEKLPYIFDRFYKGDQSREHISKSYGLGLSIAKIIVNKHHGKISCKSYDNMTTFTVHIPQK